MSRIRYLDINELNDRLSELEDLETAIESSKDDLKDYIEANGDDGSQELDTIKSAVEVAEDGFTTEERDELKRLRELKDDVGERRGKIDDEGGPFIHEADFEDYARELVEELGYLDNKMASQWPFTCIDWEKAAEELKMDYSVITWDGQDYYYRNT